jgi:hypothetical protein
MFQRLWFANPSLRIAQYSFHQVEQAQSYFPVCLYPKA